MKKQTKTTVASIAFLVIVVLHISGILFSDKLAFISKPFIITTLVIVYLAAVEKANFWYVSALFFSFIIYPEYFTWISACSMTSLSKLLDFI